MSHSSVGTLRAIIGLGTGLMVMIMAFVLPACTQAKAFDCASSEQCVRGDVTGTCEPSGACSFPDAMCTSGRRFDESAGGQCVEDTACGTVNQACCDGACSDGSTCEDDVCVAAPSCGGVGKACCAGDQCGVNASCAGGTCQQCVVDVAHGRRHGCAVRSDGSVWCWGDNGSGQLGNGTLNSSLEPVQVVLLSGGPLTDATHLSAGSAHTCALRSDGTVWCWGAGGGGRLGHGSTSGSLTPVQATVAATTAPLDGVVEIAVGDCQSCARSSDGQVLCWGCGGDGRLGDGTTSDRSRAAPVLTAAGGPALDGVVELGVDSQACVRRSDDSIWCWGHNKDGQVGNGTTSTAVTVPVQIRTGSALGVGRLATCAAASDGSVSCWGTTWRGRAAAGGPSPVPLLLSSGEPFAGAMTLAAGSVSCAITKDRQAWCWGTSNYGQTGNGTGAPTPAPVLRPSGKGPLDHVARLVAGNAHVCAFLDDGSLYCWGRNVQGDLGDGTKINRGFPTPLALQCQ